MSEIPIRMTAGRPVRQRRLMVLLALIASLSACGKSNQAPPPAPPPPAVTVIKLVPTPVTLYEEYPAQTEAINAVEIRPRVGGILERQAFADGAAVKKGDLLFIIDPEPFITALAQARASLGQVEASWLNSQQNLKRFKPLLESAAISQQDLDAAVAKERADAASVEAGKAQVRQAQLNLGYSTIRAPRDGMMSRALIKVGGLAKVNDTLLATLYSVDPMWVSFTISEQRLVQLQKQFSEREAGRKLPDFKIKMIDGSEYKYGGKLAFLDAAVDPKNGTLQVRLTVPNPQGVLRSGQFMRVVVPALQNPEAIVVPEKAVQELQGKRSVFVVGPDDKASYREIKTSARIGEGWLVEQGLKPGEVVVVEGIAKVKPGAPVKPVLTPQQAATTAPAPVANGR